MKKSIKSMALLLVAVMIFAACGTIIPANVNVNESAAASGNDGELLSVMDEVLARFPSETPQGEGVGGILNFGLQAPSPFAGIRHPIFAVTADDSVVNDFMFAELLSTDGNLMFSQAGAAWYEYDLETSIFTMHFHDHVSMYFHDGEPVTMYDVEFAYLVMAHPDVTSPRFGPALGTSLVVGVDEYRAGTSDRISGITVFNNGRSISLEFEEMSPSMLFGGIWNIPIPRHRWEAIPFGEHTAHAYSRYDILGNGAFIFRDTVPGESVALVRNPYYWQGAPKLDGIHVTRITPDVIGEAMAAGTFDLINVFPHIFFGDYEDRATNFTFYAALDRRFDFMGFRFGFWDNDSQSMVLNPDTIIWDVALRRALGYARNDAVVWDGFFHGLRFPVTTNIVPFHYTFMRHDKVGFSQFNPELANRVLDEGGFTQRDANGYRMLPSGDPLTLIWLVADSPNADLITQFHIQNWSDVGLRVELYENRLVEFNDRINILENDLDEGVIHMFDSAWNKGYNPNPRGLWGPNSHHNDTRFYSDRTNEILDAIDSPQAWDQDWLIGQYHDWQQISYDNPFIIPTGTAVLINAVNNRVLNFSMVRRDGTHQIGYNAWHLWDLSRDTPY